MTRQVDIKKVMAATAAAVSLLLLLFAAVTANASGDSTIKFTDVGDDIKYSSACTWDKKTATQLTWSSAPIQN